MHELTGQAADALTALDDAVAAIASAAHALAAHLPHLDDEQRRLAVALVGDVGRGSDALRLRVADDLVQRHDGLAKDDRFPVTCGYRDPLDMLTSELGIAHASGKRLLLAAAALRPSVALTGSTVPARFPVLGAAVVDGAVTIDQASAIVEALGDAADRANPEHLEAAERALVDSALGLRGTHPAETGTAGPPMPPALLAKVARAWRDAMDPDGAEPRYEEQLAKRSLRMRTRADGCIAGDFVCTPDQGAVLAAAFDAFTTPRTPPRFRDDARGALKPPVVAARSRGQKMIDALISIVGRAIELAQVPRVGGKSPTVVLHLSEETYRAAVAGEPGCTATDERTGEAIPVHVAAALMCDGRIQAAVTGADGKPLYLGRTQRVFSRAQRRALATRDKGCRAPGCTAPIGWCEAHHIVPWSDGGRTDIDNGIMLCAHHHHEVHRGTLEVLRSPRGWIVSPKTRPPRGRRGWATTLDSRSVYLQPTRLHDPGRGSSGRTTAPRPPAAPAGRPPLARTR